MNKDAPFGWMRLRCSTSLWQSSEGKRTKLHRLNLKKRLYLFKSETVKVWSPLRILSKHFEIKTPTSTTRGIDLNRLFFSFTWKSPGFDWCFQAEFKKRKPPQNHRLLLVASLASTLDPSGSLLMFRPRTRWYIEFWMFWVELRLKCELTSFTNVSTLTLASPCKLLTGRCSTSLKGKLHFQHPIIFFSSWYYWNENDPELCQDCGDPSMTTQLLFQKCAFFSACVTFLFLLMAPPAGV